MHALLGSVYPDDIQVAVVNALFILVGITSAALGSGPRPSSCRQLLCAAGDGETSGFELGYDHCIESTFHGERKMLENKQK